MTVVRTTAKNAVSKPPVVAILGHIDHGKSTLIDYIRKSNIVATEAGGITQHPSAYEITREGKNPRHGGTGGKREKITILDTPGHEAFSSIRTRCASAADIVVLIVSAEDGVKPQTVEVIKYIKETNTPFIVAITKIDKPAADPMKAKQTLAENDVYVEGYGGNTSVVEVSAVTGQGVDELLDLILLMSEIEKKTGDPDELGEGVIIESRLDPKRGIIATGIIQNGTVRKSLFAATEGAWAPIRFILDAEGNQVEELTFSSPIQIVGWNELPQIGKKFKTFLKKDEALEFAEKTPPLMNSRGRALGNETLASEEMAYLPLVVKTDTAGSLEVIINELKKLTKERIVPKIIGSGVGSVNENDVKLALTSPGSLIIGFHIKVDSKAEFLAERSGVEILTYKIIYELTDKVKRLLNEREPKIEVEEIMGQAKVLKLFGATKDKQVLGGKVLSGEIKKGTLVKIMRRDTEISRGRVRELQQSKIATDSVGEGLEFGAMVESKIEIAPGDVLQAVTTVTK